MKIVADIGGTHARFAVAERQGFHHVRKYRAADFPSLEAALELYCASESLKKCNLLIATAAYPDGAVWRFVNRNKWVIDAATLKKSGWNVKVIVNDFEAATRGLLNLVSEDQEILKSGVQNEKLPRCLMGPGTGLGLGYLIPVAKGYHVQMTHGGHMLAAGLSDEQKTVIATVHRLKDDKTVPVFENFASGTGLLNIYNALCLMGGKEPKYQAPEALFDHSSDFEVSEAIRLFHEFFGLFAQTVVVSGHAYGGLYLTGGMLDRLVEKSLFDFARFEEFFVLPCVDSVTRALDGTPIIRITHPFLAFKGLAG